MEKRLLNRKEAAAYCGLSPNAFDREVTGGTFPKAFPLAKVERVLWDRRALDAAMNRRSGLKEEGGEYDREARKAAWNKDRQAAAG